MPRKIGYGSFTPARRAALRKAQLESARKRRKHFSDETPHRRKKKQDDSDKRRRRKKQLILAGAAAAGIAAGVGAAVYVDKNNKKKADFAAKLRQEEADYQEFIKEHRQEEAQRQVERELLKKQAGPLTKPCESAEQWEARVRLYGDHGVLGEFSQLHEGRAEIFPTLPETVVQATFNQEMARPSYSVLDNNPDDDFVWLYHRTGGGKDHDPEAAKQSLLKSQQFKFLNRDEKRALGEQGSQTFDFIWFSDRLNDSNTRNAFGETVLRLKVPKKYLQDPWSVGAQSFGELSPIKESWVNMKADYINRILASGEVKIEEVPAEMITAPPERKWRAPR